MPTVIDLSKQRPNEAFMALFNSFWNTNYNEQNVVFEDMEIVGANPATVTCQATCLGGVFHGVRTVNWTRLNIGLYNTEANIQILTNDTPDDMQDLAPAISDALGINLMPEDIVSEPIDQTGWTFPHVLNVQIAEGSFLWFGTLTVIVDDDGIWHLNGFNSGAG